MFKLAHYHTCGYLRQGMSEITLMNELINHKGFDPQSVMIGVAFYQVIQKHEQKDEILAYINQHPAILETMKQDVDKGIYLLYEALEGITLILFPDEFEGDE